MSSSIPPSLGPRSGSEILTAFSKELDSLVNTSEESAKVLDVMKNLLSGASIYSVPKSLEKRVSELQKMFKDPISEIYFSPKAGQVVDESFRPILQEKMKVLLEEKIEEFEKLAIAKREENVRICQPLTEIPLHRIHSFVSTVEDGYQEELSKGKSPEEALIFAVAKGMVRAMVKLPSGFELSADKGLTKGVEAQIESEFGRAYEDSLVYELAMEKAMRVYGEDGTPYELYQKSTIDKLDPKMKDGKFSKDKDPRRREGTYVKPDDEAREFLDNKVLSLVYPELNSRLEGGAFLPEVEKLHDKSFMRALSVAYSVIEKKYKEALDRLPDLYTREILTEGDLEALKIEAQNLIAEVESFAREIVKLCSFFLKSLDSKREEIPSECLPALEKLLKGALEKLTSENELTVKEKYLRDQGSLITIYNQVESPFISSFAKKKVLAEAVALIDAGVSLEEINRRIVVYVDKWKISAKNREIIKTEFPKCLLGREAWKILGVDVDEELLPDNILEILRANSPVVLEEESEGRALDHELPKVGETCMLMFIPEFVGKELLGVESMGNLMKGKLENSSNGYESLNSEVAADTSGEYKAGPAHWVLLTKGILLESRGQTYDKQEKKVKDLAKNDRGEPVYEVPDLLSAIVGSYLYYAAFKEKLFGNSPWTYTRVKEMWDVGGHFVVGGFSPAGLKVDISVCGYVRNGVSALWKFRPLGLGDLALGSGS